MLERDKAIQHLKKCNQSGWIGLVNMIYDNVPPNIIITEVFQKWATLEIRYEGESEVFQKWVDKVSTLSNEICEVCGDFGSYSMIDGWDTTLCDTHFDASKGVHKYRRDGK
ncbi:MAG: hypothetical protein P1U56_20840 [Saprospiraceae bacterium]|nr:hypothetical protein [Saprospiraceae bacterium]